ncbi:MAG: YceI family protein [Bacteroidetes bacterium]|nr:YceI family protein [Bacteroidota bacterium]
MRPFFLSFLTMLFLCSYEVHGGQEVQFYYTDNGHVSFKSEAKQLIKATSDELRGVLDPVHKTFVFKVALQTFKGFNSSLQQEHFNEKYLESEKYPEATFMGKIIETVNLTQDGVYDIRAKGKFWIHGIEQERIIRSLITIKGEKITLEAHFNVLLSDHNIKVPKVVHEKIASEISVDIKAQLNKKYN